ncbi:MAG: outer membrane lipid asymmetry maintenance protein MlaD [Alphaproteobacteria bacterium]|nr:outer membrane lipid asymmetry maintenance protein MlaD [Alphaproteobacteria bacterium]
MQNSIVETLIGAVVIAVAALFLMFAYTSTGSGPVRGYDVVAEFNRADGVNTGTDVRMSGIKVGAVSGMRLDPQTYSAVLTLALENSIKIPDDSSARITSEGLLGSQYVSIEPGGSQDFLVAGGRIENTQGAVDLMGLIGKVMFSAGATPAAGGAAVAAPSGAPAGP